MRFVYTLKVNLKLPSILPSVLRWPRPGSETLAQLHASQKYITWQKFLPDQQEKGYINHANSILLASRKCSPNLTPIPISILSPLFLLRNTTL